MEEAANAIKKWIKTVGKRILIKLLPIILCVAIVVVIIAGATYIIMKWTSKVVSESANEYTSEVSINADGSVSTSKNSQQIWNEMIEKGYPVNEYLDGPEELAKLMQAELVTRIPDTRSNVDEPINWDEIFKNLNSTSSSSSSTSAGQNR